MDAVEMPRVIVNMVFEKRLPQEAGRRVKISERECTKRIDPDNTVPVTSYEMRSV
jgi:hypothetical protein